MCNPVGFDLSSPQNCYYYPGFCRIRHSARLYLPRLRLRRRPQRDGPLPCKTRSGRDGFDDDRSHKYALPHRPTSYAHSPPTVTPFDVIKTRLQTQPKELLSRTAYTRCCQPLNVPCVRNMSSLAHPFPAEEVICVYDHGVLRKERVSGFLDAVRHVVKAEGIRGLWKGAGTSL